MSLSLATFQGTERFRLLRLLGQGGMGMVYEAIDEQLDAHVALKVLPLVSPERLLRFKREFRVASEIHHEHLVRLGELVRAGDHWFFTMELVHGVDLLTYVRGPDLHEDLGSQVTAPDSTMFSGVAARPRTGAPRPAPPARPWGSACDEDKLRRSLLQLAEALVALHRAGCIHRDVKPTNVLVTDDGRAVLLDYGLASVGSADTSVFSAGTPLYMAPEQATQEPPTPASDWYAFGVLAFELLTGRVPFNGHVYEVISAKQTALAPSVLSLAPDAPADLALLIDALLARLPAARPDGEAVLRALGAAHSPSRPSFADLREDDAVALVGREPEWQVLEQLLAQVEAAHEPIALVIRGESGVGKSTLARKFAARLAEREQAYVFRGRCHERELVPFNAVDGLFDALSHTLRHFDDEAATRVVPPRAGVLAQVFPVLARVPAIARAELPSFSLDRREVRSWLFEAARGLVRGLAAERPVVLYVDDLQWADEDSLALLSHLLRPAGELRLFLICTLRTHGGAQRSSDQQVFGASVDERTFTLGNLSADSAQRLAEQLAPSGLSPEQRARLAHESGGHPLFLRELAEEALAEPGTGLTLNLDAVLRRRVDRLLAGPRRVLSLLAVAATPLSLAVLRASAHLSQDALASAVHALRAARLVHLSIEAENDGLDISHERIRRAAREAVEEAAVPELHLALAESLEASGDSVRSAWHWREAGEPQRAATHYRSAGLRAMRALAFGEAVSHLRAAKELGQYGPADDSALCAELADALASAGRGAEAARHYRLAATHTTPARVIELKRRAAEELVRSGYLEEGMMVAREVLSDAKLKVARTPLRSLLVERARLKLRGLSAKPEPEHETDHTAHELARVDLCWSFFCGLVLTDHVQGAYFQAKALNLALASGDRYRIARAIAAEAAYTASRGVGHRERSQKLFARAEVLTRAVDKPQALGTLRLMQGIAAHMNGRFAEAAVALHEAMTLFRERCTGVSWELDASRQFALECAFYLGRLRELRTHVEAGLREAEERGSIYSSTNLRTGLTNAAWLMDDDPGRARGELLRGMEQWSSRGFHIQHWYELIASLNVDLYEGLGEQAFTRVEQRIGALSRSHLLRISHVGAAAAELRARCALASLPSARGADERKKRLAIVRDCERTLVLARTPWTSALAALLTLSRTRAEHTSVDQAEVTRVRAALLAADSGVFALALDVVYRDDDSGLRAQGVVDPARFARMLVPL